MKKFFTVFCSVLLIVATMCCLASCAEPTKEQLLDKYGEAIEKEMRGSFDFFWNEAQTNETSPAYGLIADRAGATKNSDASIASVGFGLAAMVVGAEEGYVTKEEAQKRAEGTLKTLLTLQTNGTSVTQYGFFTHFLDMNTAKPASGSEISSIDTAIMLCGALTAAEYFGGEVETLANQIYSNVDWTSMRMTKNTKHYIAMTFNSSGNPTTPWDYYAEQLMIYVLGAGSPNEQYRLDDAEYYDFTRAEGIYNGHKFYYSWFGSIFTYQFSHAFIDFRNKEDRNGTNWWNNSIEASESAYDYCRKNANISETYKKGGWGLTACDIPGGYSGELGCPPRGWTPNEDYARIQGTVAPCGALGSVVFTPKYSLEALEYYQSIRFINGKYGLLDSYNLDRDYYGLDYIGIDKGITLLMLYNYTCDGVWNLTNNNEYIKNGLQVLGFTAA